MMGLRFPERLLRVLVAISLLLGITMAGCADDPTSSGSGTAVTASYPSGYAEPVETVTALLAALDDPDPDVAATALDLLASPCPEGDAQRRLGKQSASGQHGCNRCRIQAGGSGARVGGRLSHSSN